MHGYVVSIYEYIGSYYAEIYAVAMHEYVGEYFVVYCIVAVVLNTAVIPMQWCRHPYGFYALDSL